jgi:hypothetical protein
MPNLPASLTTVYGVCGSQLGQKHVIAGLASVLAAQCELGLGVTVFSPVKQSHRLRK